MKTTYSIVLLIIFCVVTISTKNNNSSPQTEKRWQSGTVIVKMKVPNASFQKTSIASSLLSLQAKYNIQSIDRLINTNNKKQMIGREVIERIFVFKTSDEMNIPLLAGHISQEPSVEYAEPNYILKSHSVPNDPLFQQIYQLGIVHADSAWSIQKGDSTVVIGIIDTGVDWNHPDLAESIWKNSKEIPGNNIDDDENGYVDDIHGWDFLENGFDVFPGEDSTTQDNDPMDFDGHGTHVAGIAAGVTNNGIGISSLGWGCKIMPLRIGWHQSNGDGVGYSSDMAKAFVYAADNGASICNLSFGTTGAVLDVALYAYKNGVVIVNSAGNSNADESEVLGSQSWALSVAATNNKDEKASYSSYNISVDISAPGGDFSSGNFTGFLSTIVHPSNFYGNDQYVQFQGTSMASPMVAALAGLIKSQHKNWNPAEIMFQIVETADNIDPQNPLYVKKLGSGRINAIRALTERIIPKPKLELVNIIIDDKNGGNGNRLLDPGETVQLNCILQNNWGDAFNVSGELLSNNSSISITKNKSNFGTVRGISNIDSSEHGSIDAGFTINVTANALPQTISFTLNITSTNGYSTQLKFELRISAKLLFVDDDDGSNNIEQYFYKAFNHNGVVFDTWNRTTQGELPFDYLQKYKGVVWACEWAFPSLDISDRNILTTYLNGGGSLFLSGQDIGWDLADSAGGEFLISNGASKAFFEKYLKAKYISDDAVNNNLSGILENTISDGMTILRNQPGRTFSEQFPDVIDTINGSSYCFLYNGGNFASRGGAINYSKEYKLIYFGFGGFESITDSNKRNIVMERIIRFLSPEIPVTSVNNGAVNQAPSVYLLEQNYPNPFNPSTTINYQLPSTSHVSLEIFDIMGREVATLVNEIKETGNHSVIFNKPKLSSGVYYYRIRAGSFFSTKRMVLLK